MANPSRRKGIEFERAVVTLWNAHGLNAKRVPLSGAMRGYKGDIHFECQGLPKVAECKSYKSKFKTIRGWLGDNDILVVKDNRTEPLVIMKLSDYTLLAGFK